MRGTALGKPMWRIGIALISQCDARYFAGDADVIDRHRLKLGCDSTIIWTCRSDLPLESDFRHSIPELDWSGLDRLEQYSPQWLLTRAVPIRLESSENSLDLSLHRVRYRVVGSSEHPKTPDLESHHCYPPTSTITSLDQYPPTSTITSLASKPPPEGILASQISSTLQPNILPALPPQSRIQTLFKLAVTCENLFLRLQLQPTAEDSQLKIIEGDLSSCNIFDSLRKQ
ncbi:hypothetical protein PGTUg99_000586 [Puccinia graminis f. sp. tritici]|uniref:Uncharacterized protein n=1 Tax=Puccinia graminis f. sp. tritici TaxID=56615 RepID=A0A5B0P987_PUCGR|nr:hypothetical protein PGTUg99_000586 [Puccinia graminis f. sp. tritici]